MSDTKLGYYIHSESWWADAQPDRGFVEEIMLGQYGDGCRWEFAFRWYELGGKPMFKLEMFHDSLAALAELDEMFKCLANMHGKNPSPDLIIELLHEFDAIDMTERKAPHETHRCEKCGQALAAARGGDS